MFGLRRSNSSSSKGTKKSEKPSRPASLTESAIKAVTNEEGWEDVDTRSDVRSKVSSRSSKSDKKKSRTTRSRSTSRERRAKKDIDDRRRDSRPNEKDHKSVTGSEVRPRGESRKANGDAIDRAIYNRFPGQYDQAIPGPSVTPHAMPSNVQSQFPGQFPSDFAHNAFGRAGQTVAEGGHGLAADYYGDQGQSVSTQPGVRPERISTNPPHLRPASSKPEPAMDTGSGTAADYYGSANTASQGHQSRPPRPGPVPHVPSSQAEASVAMSETATFYTAEGVSQAAPKPHSYSTDSRPIDNGDTYYATPPQQSSSFPAMAAGAAGLAASAYAAHSQHQNSHSAIHVNHSYEDQFIQGVPSSLGQGAFSPSRHRRSGPIDKLLDIVQNKEDIRRMEEYTEYIGICKYCFDPRSSAHDAPRSHHYHRRRSSDSFKRRSTESLRQATRRAGKHSGVDKDARYHSSSSESGDRRRNKAGWLGAGLAGVGLTKLGHALWNNRNDFDDIYSVRTGRSDRPPTYTSHETGRSSHRTERGAVGVDGHRAYVNVRHADGSITKELAANHAPRSRSREGPGPSSVHIHGSPRRSHTHSHRHSHSRSRSRSPTLGQIFGFTSSKSKAKGSSSPRKRHDRSPKRKGFFNFGNASTSSSSSESAFGNSPRKRKSSSKGKRRDSAEHLQSTLLGIGATAAALAAAQGGRRPEVVAVREKKTKRTAHERSASSRNHDIVEEDGWESASESESAASVLAYGDTYTDGHSIRRRTSNGSLSSQSSGTGKWGWRWGGASKRKERRPTSPTHTAQSDRLTFTGIPPHSSPAQPTPIRPAEIASVASSRMGPMQFVDPVPVEDSPAPSTVRPYPTQYTPSPGYINYHPAVETPTRTAQDLPQKTRTTSSPSHALRNTAIAGGFAAVAAGAITADRARGGRQDSNVRFDIPEQHSPADRPVERTRSDRFDDRRSPREKVQEVPEKSTYSKPSQDGFRQPISQSEIGPQYSMSEALPSTEQSIEAGTSTLDDHKSQLAERQRELEALIAAKRKELGEREVLEYASHPVAVPQSGAGRDLPPLENCQDPTTGYTTQTFRPRRRDTEDDDSSPDSPADGSRNDEDLTRQAEIARNAAARIVADMAARYNSPQVSQAEFFTPQELDKQAIIEEEEKARQAALKAWVPNADVQIHYTMHADDFRRPDRKTIVSRKDGVPHLGLIVPTPPVSIAGSVLGQKSPVSAPLPMVEAEENTESTGRPRSDKSANRVSWGPDDTRFYEIQSPHQSPELEKDGKFPTENEIVEVEVNEPDEKRNARFNFHDLPSAATPFEDTVYSAEPEVIEQSTRDDTNADDRPQMFYRSPYFETVSDLGFALDSPGTEGAPPVQGFVEGEVDEPTPVVEQKHFVPGAFEQHENGTRSPDVPHATKPDFGQSWKIHEASSDIGVPTYAQSSSFMPEASAMDKNDEDLDAKSELWDLGLSKKDKKKREKAARRAAGDLASVEATPSFEQPIREPAINTVEDAWEAPLSKKEKKKREKVSRQATDEFISASATPLIDTLADPLDIEPSWEPPLSKKEQKKRDKLVRQSQEINDDEQDYSTPSQERGLEQEQAWEPPLSKKEQKKRDKLARLVAENMDPMSSPNAEPKAEETWEPTLTKKEQKKRDKLTKLAEEDSGPASSSIVEPRPDETWEPTLSKKEQKRRDKLAKLAGEESNPVSPIVVEPEHEETWEPALSKKEQKKRDKLAKLAGEDSNPVSPSVVEPELEETWEPALSRKELKKREKEEAARSASHILSESPTKVDEHEEFWSKPLSKKDKKKLEKERRRSAGDSILKRTDSDTYNGQNGSSRSEIVGSRSYEADDHYENKSEKRRSFGDVTAAFAAGSVAGLAADEVLKSNGHSKEKIDSDIDDAIARRDSDAMFDVPGSFQEQDRYETDEERRLRKKKSRQSADYDDTISMVSGISEKSSRSRTGRDDSSSKKDKKGGILGLFRRKSSDANGQGEALDDRDDQSRSERHHRRKGTGDLDDTRSTTSLSRRSHADYGDPPDDSRRDRRRDSTPSDRRDQQDQSFLAGRVENEELQSLSANNSSSPTLAPESVPETILPESIPLPTDENEQVYLEPSESTSMGSPSILARSPALETPRRPSILPVRPSSTTAIPIRFRRPPQTPSAGSSPVMSHHRSESLGNSLPASPDSPALQSSRSLRVSRPRSTEVRREFQPLYLVEHNRKLSDAILEEERFPPLPLSEETSRASSIRGSDGYESALEEQTLSEAAALALPTSDIGYDTRFEDVLSSNQTTPRASQFPADALQPRHRAEPEFYSWEDILREEKLRNELAETHDESQNAEQFRPQIAELSHGSVTHDDLVFVNSHDQEAGASVPVDENALPKSADIDDLTTAEIRDPVRQSYSPEDEIWVSESIMAPEAESEPSSAFVTPFEEPEQAFTVKPSKKDKKKKAKTPKLGTAIVNSDDVPERISPQDAAKRQEQDTQDAIDGLFGDTPAFKYVPKGKKKGKAKATSLWNQTLSLSQAARSESAELGTGEDLQSSHDALQRAEAAIAEYEKGNEESSMHVTEADDKRALGSETTQSEDTHESVPAQEHAPLNQVEALAEDEWAMAPAKSDKKRKVEKGKGVKMDFWSDQPETEPPTGVQDTAPTTYEGPKRETADVVAQHREVSRPELRGDVTLDFDEPESQLSDPVKVERKPSLEEELKVMPSSKADEPEAKKQGKRLDPWSDERPEEEHFDATEDMSLQSSDPPTDSKTFLGQRQPSDAPGQHRDQSKGKTDYWAVLTGAVAGAGATAAAKSLELRTGDKGAGITRGDEERRMGSSPPSSNNKNESAPPQMSSEPDAQTSGTRELPRTEDRSGNTSPTSALLSWVVGSARGKEDKDKKSLDETVVEAQNTELATAPEDIEMPDEPQTQYNAPLWTDENVAYDESARMLYPEHPTEAKSEIHPESNVASIAEQKTSPATRFEDEDRSYDRQEPSITHEGSAAHSNKSSATGPLWTEEDVARDESQRMLSPEEPTEEQTASQPETDFAMSADNDSFLQHVSALSAMDPPIDQESRCNTTHRDLSRPLWGVDDMVRDESSRLVGEEEPAAVSPQIHKSTSNPNQDEDVSRNEDVTQLPGTSPTQTPVEADGGEWGFPVTKKSKKDKKKKGTKTLVDNLAAETNKNPVADFPTTKETTLDEAPVIKEHGAEQLDFDPLALDQPQGNKEDPPTLEADAADEWSYTATKKPKKDKKKRKSAASHMETPEPEPTSDIAPGSHVLPEEKSQEPEAEMIESAVDNKPKTEEPQEEQSPAEDQPRLVGPVSEEPDPWEFTVAKKSKKGKKGKKNVIEQESVPETSITSESPKVPEFSEALEKEPTHEPYVEETSRIDPKVAPGTESPRSSGAVEDQPGPEQSTEDSAWTTTKKSKKEKRKAKKAATFAFEADALPVPESDPVYGASADQGDEYEPVSGAHVAPDSEAAPMHEGEAAPAAHLTKDVLEPEGRLTSGPEIGEDPNTIDEYLQDTELENPYGENELTRENDPPGEDPLSAPVTADEPAEEFPWASTKNSKKDKKKAKKTAALALDPEASPTPEHLDEFDSVEPSTAGLPTVPEPPVADDAKFLSDANRGTPDVFGASDDATKTSIPKDPDDEFSWTSTKKSKKDKKKAKMAAALTWEPEVSPTSEALTELGIVEPSIDTDAAIADEASFQSDVRHGTIDVLEANDHSKGTTATEQPTEDFSWTSTKKSKKDKKKAKKAAALTSEVEIVPDGADLRQKSKTISDVELERVPQPEQVPTPSFEHKNESQPESHITSESEKKQACEQLEESVASDFLEPYGREENQETLPVHDEAPLQEPIEEFSWTDTKKSKKNKKKVKKTVSSTPQLQVEEEPRDLHDNIGIEQSGVPTQDDSRTATENLHAPQPIVEPSEPIADDIWAFPTSKKNKKGKKGKKAFDFEHDSTVKNSVPVPDEPVQDVTFNQAESSTHDISQVKEDVDITEENPAGVSTLVVDRTGEEELAPEEEAIDDVREQTSSKKKGQKANNAAKAAAGLAAITTAAGALLRSETDEATPELLREEEDEFQAPGASEVGLREDPYPVTEAATFQKEDHPADFEAEARLTVPEFLPHTRELSQPEERNLASRPSSQEVFIDQKFDASRDEPESWDSEQIHRPLERMIMPTDLRDLPPLQTNPLPKEQERVQTAQEPTPFGDWSIDPLLDTSVETPDELWARMTKKKKSKKSKKGSSLSTPLGAEPMTASEKPDTATEDHERKKVSDHFDDIRGDNPVAIEESGAKETTEPVDCDRAQSTDHAPIIPQSPVEEPGISRIKDSPPRDNDSDMQRQQSSQVSSELGQTGVMGVDHAPITMPSSELMENDREPLLSRRQSTEYSQVRKEYGTPSREASRPPHSSRSEVQAQPDLETVERDMPHYPETLIHDTTEEQDLPIEEDVAPAFTVKMSKKDKRKAKKDKKKSLDLENDDVAAKAIETDEWAPSQDPTHVEQQSTRNPTGSFDEPSVQTKTSLPDQFRLSRPLSTFDWADDVEASAKGNHLKRSEQLHDTAPALEVNTSQTVSADLGEEGEDVDFRPQIIRKMSKKEKRKAKKNQFAAVEPEEEPVVAEDPVQIEHRSAIDQGVAGQSPHLEEQLQSSMTSTHSSPHSPSRDIDFAATLAAGLEQSGFDSNVVIDDPAFHRRSTPPGANAEADPEEAFPMMAKKTKKGKKGRKSNIENAPENAQLADRVKEEANILEAVPSSSADVRDEGTAPSTDNNDFDTILAASLGAAGFAASKILRKSDEALDKTAEAEVSPFTLPRKKRKGKKAQLPADDYFGDATAREAIAAAEVIPAELEEVDTQDVAPQANVQDQANRDETSFPTKISPAPVEAGEDEWAVSSKKRGKKGKGKNAESPMVVEPAATEDNIEVPPIRVGKKGKKKNKKGTSSDWTVEEPATEETGTSTLQEKRQNGTGDTSDKPKRMLHTSEISQNLPTQIGRTSSRHSDRFAEDQLTEGLSPRAVTPVNFTQESGWSFDRLDNERDSGLPAEEQRQNHPHEIVRDSGYDTIGESSNRNSGDKYDVPETIPEHGKTEQDSDDRSVASWENWDLTVDKSRTVEDREQPLNTERSRRPSPIESTTKDRTSYLFQTPPTGERRGPRPTRLVHTLEDTQVGAAKDDPAIPVDYVPVESPVRKRSKANSDVGAPEHGVKATRRTETPVQSFRKRMDSTPRPAPLDLGEEHMRQRSNGQSRLQSLRSPTAMSSASAASLQRLRSPELVGTPSINASIISNDSPTPSLRRTDRSISGDLRHRAATARGDTSDLERSTSRPSTTNNPPFRPPPTPPLNDDERPGHSAGASMADNVFEGYGGGEPLAMSPTRAQSMRRKQSSHIMDLEARMDALIAENQRLHELKDGQSGDRSTGNADGSDAVRQALEESEVQLREKDAQIHQIKAMLESLQQELERLTEVNSDLTAANKNLIADTNDRYATLQDEHQYAHEQWQQSVRDLDKLRLEHSQLSNGMESIVRQHIDAALEDKDTEIVHLRAELELATSQIRELQAKIQASTSDNFLTSRDEDYFDRECQKLCQHVQAWVLRFSKSSDNRACRLTSDIKDDKLEARLDNCMLDGSDVDNLLVDRIRRRDVFMALFMTMIWEYVFTRYLFGMDREQRQKLKSLEKILMEVGPPRAVAQWRATTLTLLSQRPAFETQLNLDHEAVTFEIYNTLAALLPPPRTEEAKLQSSLKRVVRLAIDLSIEMRTQRADYFMLPPPMPEYDANGDLIGKTRFDANTMSERSGDYASNEELQAQNAVVKVVLFPLVMKKGDDAGEGGEEAVICPAQVLVTASKHSKRVVRQKSGVMSVDDDRATSRGSAERSRLSLMSGIEGGSHYQV